MRLIRIRLRGLILTLYMAAFLLLGPAFATMTYTVKAGDTLESIGKRFSVSAQTLQTYNVIKDPRRLQIGQTVKIPPIPPPPNHSATTNTRELAKARAQHVQATKSDTAPVSESSVGEQIVAAARQYIGTPYSWGGSSSRGMDCSGLVVRVMVGIGKDVPHQSAELFAMGTKVTYEQLRPGDLLFFNTNGRGVSHVGIWVGNNNFIHASSDRGVCLQAVERYYADHLVGARRLTQ